MERFTVEPSDKVWFIKDNECKRWQMPLMAVSIYFRKKYRANKICAHLNNEWKEFVNNPN